MPTSGPGPQIVTLEESTVAVVREEVPMSDLTAFYDRAFHAAMAALQAKDVAVTGPPVGVYLSMPTTTVDVAAGFPTSEPVTADGVTAMSLPAGRAVQVLHRGSYDSMQDTYAELMSWVEGQGLALGPVMWESYLTDPSTSGPEATETLITWPLAD